MKLWPEISALISNLPCTKYKNSESLGNIHHQIIEYIEIICDNIHSDIKEKSRAHHHVNEIEKHVNVHFTNPDLNISSIGHHFNMTPSYISRILKNKGCFLGRLY